MVRLLFCLEKKTERRTKESLLMINGGRDPYPRFPHEKIPGRN